MTILPGALAVVLPLSLTVWFIFYLSPFRNSESELSPLRCFMSIFIPSILLYNAAKHKKLDTIAMAVAFVMGFVETLSNMCMIATTVTFFLAGTRATKYKRWMKKFDEDHFKQDQRRNWIQVLSNGGVGMELAILMLIERGPGNEAPVDFSRDYLPNMLSLAFLGSLACACGDTLASELAPALTNSRPRLITNPFIQVPKGTNGGITLVGLFFSAFGGFLCGLSYLLVTYAMVSRDILNSSPAQWPLLVLGTFCGLLGSLIDSILGASLQFSGFDRVQNKVVGSHYKGVEKICGSEILDNHSVNLLSTLLTAIIAPFVARSLWNSIG